MGWAGSVTVGKFSAAELSRACVVAGACGRLVRGRPNLEGNIVRGLALPGDPGAGTADAPAAGVGRSGDSGRGREGAGDPDLRE